MQQNIWKIGFRQVRKNLGHILINAFGLGIAIALSVVAYLNWKFDRDFDTCHPDIENTYRINTVKAGTQELYGVSPLPLAQLVKDKLPAVESVVLWDSRNMVIKYGQQTLRERIHYVSGPFFEMFHAPLVSGTTDLSSPSTILLTESTARKYFGTRDPIGESILLAPGESNQQTLIVVGVLEDPPLNSSIFYDFITSFSNRLAGGSAVELTDWSFFVDATFVTMQRADREKVVKELNTYVDIHSQSRDNWETHSFNVEPLTAMAHQASELRWNALNSSLPPASIWGNLLMALLLLLTACFNFANMTIALSDKRLKEIGIRKVLGSSRKQLITQLYAECFLVCLVALFIGVWIAEWLIQLYNQAWRFLDLELVWMDNWALIGFVFILLLFTTLLAGSYPALYMSSFSPSKIFRGTLKFGGKAVFSRILLSLQLIFALTAVVAGVNFARNAAFQENTDLGFNRDGIQAVFINNNDLFSPYFERIKTHPSIVEAAGVRSHIGDSPGRITFKYKGQSAETELLTVGEQYLELVELQLKEGRSFDYNLSTDFQRSIIVNQYFVDQFISEGDPINQQVTLFDTSSYQIIGIVENYLADSFFDPVRPSVIRLRKDAYLRYVVVKTDEKDMLSTHDFLQSTWHEMYPNHPFEHFYQDYFIAGDLEVTNNIKWSMFGIAGISILLTVLGLFSLISLTVMKRMKEIAVRRVLGATLNNIFSLLGRHYLLFIALGLILGCISGSILALGLLSSVFQWHVGISIWPALTVTAGSLIVLLAVVGFKIMSLRRMDPAQVLRPD